jgi:hypothetical protein
MASKLYTSEDLLKGYVAGQPESYVKTWDFRQFVAFTMAGGPEPKYLKDREHQARHDAQLSHALGEYSPEQIRKRVAAYAGEPRRLASNPGSFDHAT